MKLTIRRLEIALFSFILLFSSCISTKNFTAVVKSKISETKFDSHSFDSTSISLVVSTLNKNDSLVTVKKVKAYFIPAIFYWGWNRTYGCDISSEYFVNKFSEILKNKAIEFNIAKHLGTRKLELKIEEVPSYFSYTKNGMFLYAVFAYGYSMTEAIYPDEKKFKVSYCIREGETIFKQGSFENRLSQPMPNTYGTTSKFIGKYLDKLNENMALQSNALLDKIVDELY